MQSNRERGFTLVELMVVTAIVGILVAVAIVSLDPGSYSKGAKGYAEQVTATMENIRLRATASRKWQRVEVNADSIVHMEAEAQGMGAPAAYYVVQTVSVPGGVLISAASERTHRAQGDSVPAQGDGIGNFIDFAPDGSGTGATIFIRDDADDNRYRVAVYRATGLSHIFAQW